MSAGNKSITVSVRGITYQEYAKLRWQQFIRFYSLVLAIGILLMLWAIATGRLSSDLPGSFLLVLAILILGVLAISRSTIRGAYKRSGLSELAVDYVFDRDGWTVRQGSDRTTVAWSKTRRVRRDRRCLLLYPNRRSVNIVPLRFVSSEQLSRIIGWCSGKK